MGAGPWWGAGSQRDVRGRVGVGLSTKKGSLGVQDIHKVSSAPGVARRQVAGAGEGGQQLAPHPCVLEATLAPPCQLPPLRLLQTRRKEGKVWARPLEGLSGSVFLRDGRKHLWWARAGVLQPGVLPSLGVWGMGTKEPRGNPVVGSWPGQSSWKDMGEHCQEKPC